MNGETDQIPGGHILLSRKIFDSAIWEKPPQYFRLWAWIIGKAVFQDGHTYKGHVLKRGELITTYGEISKVLAYRYNRAIIKPSQKEIRVMLEWLQSQDMIFQNPLLTGLGRTGADTGEGTRAYLGLKISVVKYDTYQDSKSYLGGDQGRDQNGTRAYKRKNEEKECINTPCDFSSQISSLAKRYPEQEIINQAFNAIASNRKTNRISDSVKLSILKSWDQYTIESVLAGIRTYLEKECASQGKGEKYLLGIIRNKPDETYIQDRPTQNTNTPSVPILEGFYCQCCGKELLLPSERTDTGCVYCDAFGDQASYSGEVRP